MVFYDAVTQLYYDIIQFTLPIVTDESQMQCHNFKWRAWRVPVLIVT